MPDAIHTIGHATRELDAFVALLRAHGIRHLVDVRTIPRSRRNPQFNRESLPAGLAARGLRYTHRAGLGGRRHAKRDSINTGWRNESFRAYADHMQTDEFRQALDALVDLARQEPVAIMCAEAVPWRCHRSLVSDALTARGVPVFHILSPHRAQAHTMTSFARVDGDRVTYPAEGLDLPFGTDP